MLLAAAASAAGAPVPAERAKEEKRLAALAAGLHGSWVGGPCEGRITFRRDGTYEWIFRGPGGDSEGGTWFLRPGTPHPKLVLKCKMADDRKREGGVVELKLTPAGERGFTLQDPEDARPMRFAPGE
jgi:hypothetical protein